MTLIMHLAPHDQSITIFHHWVSLRRVQSNKSCPKPNGCQLILQKQSTWAFVKKEKYIYMKGYPENNLAHSADVTHSHTQQLLFCLIIFRSILFSLLTLCQWRFPFLFTVTPHNCTQCVTSQQRHLSSAAFPCLLFLSQTLPSQCTVSELFQRVYAVHTQSAQNNC